MQKCHESSYFLTRTWAKKPNMLNRMMLSKHISHLALQLVLLELWVAIGRTATGVVFDSKWMRCSHFHARGRMEGIANTSSKSSRRRSRSGMAWSMWASTAVLVLQGSGSQYYAIGCVGHRARRPSSGRRGSRGSAPTSKKR